MDREKRYILKQLKCYRNSNVFAIGTKKRTMSLRKCEKIQKVIINGSVKNKSSTDLDKEYEERTERMNAAKEVLIEFSKLIRKTFEVNEIHKYLSFNPGFGPLGHVFSQKAT